MRQKSGAHAGGTFWAGDEQPECLLAGFSTAQQAQGVQFGLIGGKSQVFVHSLKQRYRIMKVAIIGAGNVATIMEPADQTKGHEVVQVMNRSIPSAGRWQRNWAAGLPIIQSARP